MEAIRICRLPPAKGIVCVQVLKDTLELGRRGQILIFAAFGERHRIGPGGGASRDRRAEGGHILAG